MSPFKAIELSISHLKTPLKGIFRPVQLANNSAYDLNNLLLTA